MTIGWVIVSVPIWVVAFWLGLTSSKRKKRKIERELKELLGENYFGEEERKELRRNLGLETKPKAGSEDKAGKG